MFQKHKRKGTKGLLNNKGFSLIEILIAVGILAILVVPMAMNMITGARLNSKSKQAAASSDLTTSIMEIMQTVDLSDILTDVNWQARDEYDVPKDEYGTEIEYTLTGTALKNYKIASKMEVIKSADGKTYVPVSGQYDENGALQPDYLVNSSVNIRESVDGLKKAYFTGQDSEQYSFLLKGVETDEAYVDILVNVVPEQKFEIVNITSMAQSEVIYVKQSNTMDREVADEFKADNDLYVARTNDGSVPSLTSDWFLENMTRTIQVDLVKVYGSEATTITISAIYQVETDGLKDSDKTITKKLGSFSTNSTFEYARGVYVYYNPLIGGTKRDNFVINNENELAVPIFLIATVNDAAVDLSSLTNYKPTIKINESGQTHQTEARTTICSNVIESYWEKSVYPTGRQFSIKSMGNSSWQQTLYKATVQVYTHRDEAFDENGVFTPSDKYLLAETSGTFIDTSEILDISSDTQSGQVGTPGLASVDIKRGLVYDGEEKKGVVGNGVSLSGQYKAVNAGTYVAVATPIDGYTWQDGTTGPKTLTWEIARSNKATASAINHVYCAQEVTGVRGEFVEFGGIYKTDKVGTYTAYVTPDLNHCWEDGSYTTKTIKWRISPKELVVEWGIGEGKDVWNYDGQVHKATVTIHGVIEGDECVVSLTNDSIKDVGSKIAQIVAISNPNYRLPSNGLTHKITVVSAASAYVELQEEQYLVYDGKQHSAVRASDGVYFTGTSSATTAGTYTFTAHVKDGYTWDGGKTDPIDYTWTLAQRPADLVWGETTWVYNGAEHKTTCVVSNVVYGDTVTVTLSGNSITNVGEKTVYATALSNPNYVFAESKPGCKLTVTRAPLARVIVNNYTYNGAPHVGVTGQNITYNGTTQAVNVNQVGNEIKPYTCVVEPMSNYAWDDGSYGAKTVTWMIYPLKDVSYQWSDFSYSGLPTTGIFRVKNATVTGDIEKINPGEYTATITPVLNHAWPDGSVAPRTQKWHIEESQFTMPTLEDAEFTYDGESHSPTFTDGSVSEGIILSGDISATNANLPGENYCLIVTLRDGGAATTWADGTTGPLYLYWHIEPKEVGIQWHENSWTYDATNKTGQATCTQLITGDTCNFTYSNNIHKNAGTYEFTITGTDNTNYKIPTSGLKNNMTIAKREVGVSWGTITWTYDGNSHTVDPTPTNVCSADINNCDFKVTNASRTRAGTQTVTITEITNSNYRLPSDTSKLSTTLTINQKEITINWGTTTFTYNGSAQTATATAGGICNNEKYAFTYSNNSQTNATTGATAKVTGIKNGPDLTYEDYKLPATTTKTIVVNQKEIGINWSVGDWTYDESAKTVTATATGLCGNDTCTITLSGNVQTNAGTYTATATGLSNSNYKLPSSVTKEYTIKRAAVVSMKANGNFTYDGNRHDGVTLSPENANNTKYLSYTGDRYETDAGTYTCKATVKDNYAWTDGSTGTKSITWYIYKAEIRYFGGYDGFSTVKTYTGSTISWKDAMYGYDDVDWVTVVTGTTSGTNVSYNMSVQVKPDSNHKWNSNAQTMYDCDEEGVAVLKWSIDYKVGAKATFTNPTSSGITSSAGYYSLKYTLTKCYFSNWNGNSYKTGASGADCVNKGIQTTKSDGAYYGPFIVYMYPDANYAWTYAMCRPMYESEIQSVSDAVGAKVNFDGYSYGVLSHLWYVIDTSNTA